MGGVWAGQAGESDACFCMKRKPLYWLLGTIGIIVLANTPGIAFLIGIFTDTEPLVGGQHYNYVSGEKRFVSYETSDWSYTDTMMQMFLAHKQQYPTDTVLYRTFPMHPLRFWKWYCYASSKPYRLPYKAVSAAVIDSIVKANSRASSDFFRQQWLSRHAKENGT